MCTGPCLIDQQVTMNSSSRYNCSHRTSPKEEVMLRLNHRLSNHPPPNGILRHKHIETHQPHLHNVTFRIRQHAIHHNSPDPHRRRHTQKWHRQKRRPALANAQERNGLLRTRHQARPIFDIDIFQPFQSRERASEVAASQRCHHGSQNVGFHSA